MSPLSRRLLAPVLALSAAFAAACKGSDYWADRLGREPLYRRAEKVVESPSCSAMIPMEFGRSLPVPVRDAPRRFEVLYYPLTVAPGRSEARSPVFAARFSGETPAADVCRRLTNPGHDSLGPAVPPGLSNKEYYRAEAKLFSELDRVSALYLAGGTPAPADKAALAEYADAFLTLAEPGLLPDYYRANPDFWEWLRREAGRSIPKPAA